MQLVVLAGGLGIRLRGALPTGLPKSMAPIGGRPFLEILLDQGIDQGVDGIVLLTGYGAPAIFSHFGDSYRGVAVAYSVETSPLGTGGAVRHASALLEDEFVLLNGDTFTEVDLAGLVGLLSKTPLALTLTEVRDTGRFGGVRADDGVVLGFKEKSGGGPGLINAGVYACRGDLLDLFPADEAFSFERDFLEPQVPGLRPGYELSGPVFFDIGIPEDYQVAEAYFRRG